MTVVGEASAADEDQDEKMVDESTPADEKALEAAQQAMLTRTTGRDMNDAEKQMGRLVAMLPDEFENEMCSWYGEAAAREGIKILKANKTYLFEEDEEAIDKLLSGVISDKK